MKLKEIPISIYYCLRLRYKFYRNVNKEKIQLPVIISLTSMPSRLSSIDIVINSLLDQTLSPKLIILWLHSSLENKLPKPLTRLQGKYFEIKFCEGTSSYRKLLPTLKEYPSSIIITCDDDIIYPVNWLESLYTSHKQYPERVITHAGRIIRRDSQNNLLKYKSWLFIECSNNSASLLPIGFSGILYPPETFTQQVFDRDLYMELCPKADDLWFKAMGYLNNRRAYCTPENLVFIPIIGSQSDSLGKTNIKRDGNFEQWKSLCNYFPKLKEIG